MRKNFGESEGAFLFGSPGVAVPRCPHDIRSLIQAVTLPLTRRMTPSGGGGGGWGSIHQTAAAGGVRADTGPAVNGNVVKETGH